MKGESANVRTKNRRENGGNYGRTTAPLCRDPARTLSLSLRRLFPPRTRSRGETRPRLSGSREEFVAREPTAYTKLAPFGRKLERDR